MEQPRKKPKLWHILLAAALLAIAWILPGDGGSMVLWGENLLPIAILSGGIFLLKIGFFSLVVLGVRKLAEWLQNKKR